MSMIDSGALVSTVGNLAAVGIVAGVANNTMKSVSKSYRSNQHAHKTHASHKSHAFSMHKGGGKKTSSKGYSLWEGTGF